jgi:formate dehydrogenase iron-sulfur subunit
VLQHNDRPELYSGLPRDPHIAPTVELWKGVTKPIMSVALGMSVLAGFFHYVMKGPKEEPEDDPNPENAHDAREIDRRGEDRL